MRTETYRCGLDAVLDLIGGKWKALILWELREGPRRTGELRRLVEGISEKVLIQQLRDLEETGLVHRQQYNAVPPKVEYSLTVFGESLNSVLMPLCDWGEAHMDRIIAESDCNAGEASSGSPRALNAY
ncbi:MAG: helix-turn-helix transcriptional regulator [Chloroflexota bacterium]|nr:helix-turn-helix transcriptional regulator [Chloroflexota bacterium]